MTAAISHVHECGAAPAADVGATERRHAGRGKVLSKSESLSFRLTERLRARGLYALAVAIAEENHVLLREMLGRGRTASVVRARHELFVELRAIGLSYPEIGAMLDRDHTTIMAACKKAGEAVAGAIRKELG